MPAAGPLSPAPVGDEVNGAVLEAVASELASLVDLYQWFHQNPELSLKEEKTAAENKVTELEKQIVELRDGYQHKLDDLRGRIRGMLQGQLTRWLQTALDASRSDPPWTQAIQERLEDALRLIEKEIQWLQPSA